MCMILFILYDIFYLNNARGICMLLHALIVSYCESLIHADFIPLFVINDKCVAPTFSFEWNKEVLDYLACTSLHIMLQS